MQIVITEAEGLRLLQFGTSWLQGAMRLDAPDALELEYAVRMCAWLPFHDPDALAGKHLLTLGLGAGSLTRFAHNVLGMRASAVEIAPEVIAACRSHFMLPPDGERLQVAQADAAEFVRRPGLRASVDVLQVDAYDAAVDGPALDSEAFYADCRACLREGGTVAVNLVGAALDVGDSVNRIRRGLRPQAVWQFPPTEAGNVVVIAHCAAVPPEPVLAARAAAIARRWALPAPGWLALVRRTSGVAAAPGRGRRAAQSPP